MSKKEEVKSTEAINIESKPETEIQEINVEENSKAVESKPTQPNTEEKSKIFFDKQGNSFTYDEKGKIIPYIQKREPIVTPPEKKILPFVFGILSLILAIAGSVFAIKFTLDYISSGDALEFLAFLFVMLTVGWLMFLPGIIFSIIALTCNILASKSCKLGIRIFSIILSVLSAICVFSVIVLPFVLLFVASA